MSEIKLTEKETKLLELLIYCHNGEFDKTPNDICKEIGLGAAYGTLLIKNEFFVKYGNGYIWNSDKPRPNIHMIRKLTDEVKRYGREANQRHTQKKKREAYEAEIAQYKTNFSQCIDKLPQEFSFIVETDPIFIEQQRLDIIDKNWEKIKNTEIKVNDPTENVKIITYPSEPEKINDLKPKRWFQFWK
jgi:hypothetical protein